MGDTAARALAEGQVPRAQLAGIHLRAMEVGLRGDLDGANPLQEETLRLARAGDDAWFLSVALDNLGSLRMSQQAFEQAVELFEVPDYARLSGLAASTPSSGPEPPCRAKRQSTRMRIERSAHSRFASAAGVAPLTPTRRTIVHWIPPSSC